MGGFWKDRNREKRDQREIFNLSGLDTVQKRVEEDCAFYTYYHSLINHRSIFSQLPYVRVDYEMFLID